MLSNILASAIYSSKSESYNKKLNHNFILKCQVIVWTLAMLIIGYCSRLDYNYICFHVIAPTQILIPLEVILNQQYTSHGNATRKLPYQSCGGCDIVLCSEDFYCPSVLWSTRGSYLLGKRSVLQKERCVILAELVVVLV